MAAREAPSIYLYVWDGLVVAFLFTWTLGLLIELQRSEVLSLDKFLHLPVSLKGAFLINYVSSLFSLSMLAFLPAMLAFSLGTIFAKGPLLLVQLPLLAAFLLMVTALTYQLQGWLASLMVNKRRRRTVIVTIGLLFVLICQLPQLVHVFQPWNTQQSGELTEWRRIETTKLDESFAAKAITKEKYNEELDRIQREVHTKRVESESQFVAKLERTVSMVNLAVPPGWLPFGAEAAAEGRLLPGMLGTAGMASIGVLSLWRSYRTTVRLYTGQYTARKRVAAASVAVPALQTNGKPVTRFLERRLPGVSEQAAAVALGGFKSLIRAPESKMMLLTPIIMVIVFGSMFFTKAMDPPEFTRPLMAYGATAMILLSMANLIGNQFGFDRGGFRVFVLSAAPRREILLGKNLAAAPLALGLGLVAVTLVEVFYPMRIDHFLAVLPQMVAMYMLYCMVANWLSIFAAVPIRTGTMKPASIKVVPVLLHVGFALLFPLALSPALLPLGVEFAVQQLTGIHLIPIYLILIVLECAAVALLYRLVLGWQGRVLQSRELKILETVTTKEE
jgi:hypothetical protein